MNFTKPNINDVVRTKVEERYDDITTTVEAILPIGSIGKIVDIQNFNNDVVYHIVFSDKAWLIYTLAEMNESLEVVS